jgi:hypothetical protein
MVNATIKPTGKLTFFQSETEPLYVNVHRVGMRRKYVDTVGRVFIKSFNKYWKFPEQVEH